jgi:PqqD family protein of HPr-rel-A system
VPDDTFLWHVPASTRLCWRNWGDEYIVYNAASGQTHYLNLFAAKVLQYFEAEPASLDALLEDVSVDDIARRADGQPLLAQVRELIKEMDALGLIAPVVS